MDKKIKILILILAVLAAVFAITAVVSMQEKNSGKFDEFAKCLSDKGAKFYGAFWCSHCQTQKAMFGSSKKYLPYTECSTPDTNGQLQACADQQIKTYPTWKFADGSVSEGTLSLNTLSEKTGCVLP